MDGYERRQGARWPFQVPVRVLVDGDCAADYVLHSRNLGDEAVFLDTDLLLSLGDEVGIEFPLGDRRVAGWGRVTRVVGDAQRSGVVVRFNGAMAWAS